jgi:hypothetical protein
MPTGFPLMVDNAGQGRLGDASDSIITNLNGATANGLIGRLGNGLFSGGMGDIFVVQVPYTSFAVAGTDASVNIGTMPANSIPIAAGVYVEVAGDNVTILSLGVAFGSEDLVTGVDGLVALPTAYGTTMNSNDGGIAIQPASVTIFARAISTGANLNTMTQGTFDFWVAYLTARVDT